MGGSRARRQRLASKGGRSRMPGASRKAVDRPHGARSQARPPRDLLPDSPLGRVQPAHRETARMGKYGGKAAGCIAAPTPVAGSVSVRCGAADPRCEGRLSPGRFASSVEAERRCLRWNRLLGKTRPGARTASGASALSDPTFCQRVGSRDLTLLTAFDGARLKISDGWPRRRLVSSEEKEAGECGCRRTTVADETLARLHLNPLQFCALT